MLPYAEKTSSAGMSGFFSCLVLSGRVTEPLAKEAYNLYFVNNRVIERLQSRLRAAVWTVVFGVFSNFFSGMPRKGARELFLGAPILESAAFFQE